MAAQQWWRWRSNGGGQKPSESTIELYRTLFLSNKLISYVAFYVGPIQSGFLMTLQKNYSGTGIMIPVKKNAPGMENTGIQRIPAGIGNLVCRLSLARFLFQRVSTGTIFSHKNIKTYLSCPKKVPSEVCLV
jgi:hypothetical protein